MYQITDRHDALTNTCILYRKCVLALTLCAHIIVLAHTLGADIVVLAHTLCTHIKVLAHIKSPWKSIDSNTKNWMIFVEYYKYFVEYRNITTIWY